MTHSNNAKQWVSLLPTDVKTPSDHYRVWQRHMHWSTSFPCTTEKQNVTKIVFPEEMEAQRLEQPAYRDYLKAPLI